MSLRNSITSPLNLMAKPFPPIVSVWLQPHQNRLLIRERLEDRRNTCSGISCPNKNTRDGSKRVGITVACLPPSPHFHHNYHQYQHTLGSSPFILVKKEHECSLCKGSEIFSLHTDGAELGFVTCLLSRNATRNNVVFSWYLLLLCWAPGS
jgi:hypothetical protein